jgi:hypothetical membrane protein
MNDPMNVKEIDIVRISGLCGILAPIIGLGAIFISISMLPWFSWTENYLSDIGGNPGSDCLWNTWGRPSVIFNFGLVTAGVLGILFGIGFQKSGFVNGTLGNIGVIFLISDAAALIGVGLFTESTGSWHTFFSITFFVLVGLALLFITLAFLKSEKKKLGMFTLGLLILGLISVPLFVTPKPVGSNAIAEIIPIISVSIICIVFGYMMLFRKGMESPEK